MNRSLHVLLVSYEFPPEMATGGIATYMNQLAGLLHGRGHRVTVFSASANHTATTLIERIHCSNYLLPASTADNFRYASLTLFNQLKGEMIFDLIESPEVGACALNIKTVHPAIPLVVKMHTPGVLITKVSRTYQHIFIKLRFVAGALLRGRIDLGYWAKKSVNKETDFEYQLCKKADLLLSPSIALKKWAEHFWEMPVDKIQLQPNPFVPNPRLFESPLAPRKKQISFVGKLSELKGMRALTEAIPLILKKYPAYTICLAGRDEIINGKSMQVWMSQQLKAYRHQIIFTGALPAADLAEVYCQSQVCIFPSLWENYPAVVFEAMAAGAAVAAANRGGIPEIITHNKTGKLFNPLHPKEIYKAVNELLSDEKMRLKIAGEARKFICTKAAEEQLAERIEEGYQFVLKHKTNATGAC